MHPPASILSFARSLSNAINTLFLERKGILERDEENRYLDQEEGDEDPMQQVLGCSVSYRIAIGPQQGIYVVMGIVERNLVRWC